MRLSLVALFAAASHLFTAEAVAVETVDLQTAIAEVPLVLQAVAHAARPPAMNTVADHLYRWRPEDRMAMAQLQGLHLPALEDLFWHQSALLGGRPSFSPLSIGATSVGLGGDGRGLASRSWCLEVRFPPVILTRGDFEEASLRRWATPARLETMTPCHEEQKGVCQLIIVSRRAVRDGTWRRDVASLWASFLEVDLGSGKKSLGYHHIIKKISKACQSDL